MKKQFKILGAIAVAVCFAFIAPKAGNKEQITVVIDAGHGGHDHGAVYGNFTEKQIVEGIARKIERLNKDSDVVIRFTRSDDKFVSLQERVEAINKLKPDLVLSLHINTNTNPEVYGMEFLVSNNPEQSETSAKYAKRLAGKFAEKEFTIDGVKEGPLFILKKSEVPAILFAMGFLSNEIDRQYLTSEKSQEQIAATIVSFIGELK